MNDLRRNPTVLMVSHAYSEESVQKQLVALNGFTAFRLVAPKRTEVLLFPEYEFRDATGGLSMGVPTVSLFGAQFFFLSSTLGLRSQPDIVHIDYDPWQVMFWQVRLTALALSPRSVVVVGCKKNTFVRRGFRGWLKYVAGKVGFITCRLVIASSEATSCTISSMFGLPKGKVRTSTHVGVDVETFYPSSGREKSGDVVVVGYCGRLAKHKGVFDVVRAVENLIERGCPIELRFLGQGVDEAALVEMCESRPWMSVTGAVPTAEVAAFMRGLDVFVLAAHRLEDHEEHDAHALLQAMSCGVACVGSDSGIIPEILDGLHSEILFRSGDVESLMRSLSSVVSSGDLRRRLSDEGCGRVAEHYSLSRVAEQKAALYELALSLP